MGDEVIGLESDGPAVVRDGFAELSLFAKRVREVTVGLGIIRIQFNGPPIECGSVIQPPLSLERVGEVVMGVWIIGLQLDGSGERPRPPFLGTTAPSLADAVAKVAVGPPHPLGLTKMARRIKSIAISCCPTLMACDHAQEMEGLGVARLLSQDVAAHEFSFPQAAGLMMRDRGAQFECLLNRQFRHVVS